MNAPFSFFQVDPVTQARLEALFETAGIGKIAAGESKPLADPEVRTCGILTLPRPQLQQGLEYGTHWNTKRFEVLFSSDPKTRWPSFCAVFQWSGPLKKLNFWLV